MFTMYRVKVVQIILFGKIVNQYFERQESFSVAPVLKFWWWFVLKQGLNELQNFYNWHCYQIILNIVNLLFQNCSQQNIWLKVCKCLQIPISMSF